MSYFIRNGNTYRVASNEALDIQEKLPVGNYTVQEDQHGNLFLEMVDTFVNPPKLYGDTLRRAERIMTTYHSRPNSTGVMLAGEKGSGKTLLAKTLSIQAGEQGIPTILINDAYVGDKFNKFIQDIDQPCVIIFDEFEKVYDSDEQEAALTLLDGVYPSKKLFILTCNNKWRVDQHMRNRPGRIFYMLEYKGLTTDFIREYCEDNLNAKEHIDRVCQLTALYTEFNFDMLKALVEEMNRYNESPAQALEMLNARPEYNAESSYEVKVYVRGRMLTEHECERTHWSGNPLLGKLRFNYDPDPNNPASRYVSVNLTPGDIKKVDTDTGIITYEPNQDIRVTLLRVKEQYYQYADV